MSKAAKTKAYIIETSAVLFLTHGFEGTSISMLTQATGLTKGAIYGNFKDKTDLALHCFHWANDDLQGHLKAIWEEDLSALGRIRKFLNFYKEYYTHIQKWGSCPIVNLGIGGSPSAPELSLAVRAAIEQIESGLGEVLAKGQDTGEFYLSIPPMVFAKQLFALIQGGITQSLITEDAKYIKNTATYLEHLFQTAVRRS